MTDLKKYRDKDVNEPCGFDGSRTRTKSQVDLDQVTDISESEKEVEIEDILTEASG